MRIDALLPRQNCIACPDPLPCNCAANEECFVINRDCNTCSQTKCVPRTTGSGSSAGRGGVSKGATAGAIIGVLVFLAIAISLFFWYRRRSRQRSTSFEAPKDVPASAETVLKRPDPIEKHLSSQTEMNTVRVYSTTTNSVESVPESQNRSPTFLPPQPIMNMNPFDDATSIQTAGTEGTNVIPIALVPSDSDSDQLSTATYPVRPARSPDLNLNLEHVNVSGDSVRAGVSNRSVISSRNSYMSNASYSSDFLNEAPMIITPSKGAVRQVLGVVKAEVINAPGHLSSGSHLKLPPASRPAVGSPLAATSFGPADVVKEVDEGHVTIDPFSDEASINADYAASPAPSSTFNGDMSTGPTRDSATSEWHGETPNLPWARSGEDSRPSSMSTQAGSVIDIGSATRVKVGSQLSPRTPYRTTVGRLVSPNTAGTGTLGEQQQLALAHAQVQAQIQGLDPNRRVSTSSALSATSTRADSILESFPFVPPSPISNRPIRSPPVSPLAKQSFTNEAAPSSSSPNHVIQVLPPSPHVQEGFTKASAKHDSVNSVLPPPPDRRTLGLSTGSQLSTASSGLGSFPFQIDSGDGAPTPPTSFNTNGRQRASLDTLALTSDLSSYPLGFDRDSVQVPHTKS